MIFDTHAHYDDAKFDPDRQEILGAMREHGIGRIVNVSSDFPSWERTIALTEEYDFIYGALGIHPSDIDGLNEERFQWLGDQLSREKILAVGEIGLDYYWEKDPEVREQQKYWFRRQFELAKEKDLPVIIHSREAAQDTVEILEELHAEEIPVVIHCYSYSPELAQRFLKMNCYFGIGGVLTFKNAKKLQETVKLLPMEKLLLETDCPYLAPEPNRGKRNSSLNLPYVAEKMAEFKGISAEEVIRITEENAMRFYRLDRRKENV